MVSRAGSMIDNSYYDIVKTSTKMSSDFEEARRLGEKLDAEALANLFSLVYLCE